MALIYADRVQETTATTGTGSVTLAGAVSGFDTFGAALSDGDTCYYTIVDDSAGDWEVGLGTYAVAGPTLARTTVLASSNADAAVNFAAGSKRVFVTVPAYNFTSSVTFNQLLTTGNVGIGTNTPLARLDVSGDIALGAVGGGIEGAQLGLRGTSGSEAAIIDIDALNQLRIFPAINNTDMLIGHIATTGGGVALFTGATERMRIAPTGNVGIGSASPARKLVVQGSGAVYQSIVSTNDTASGLLFGDTGSDAVGQLTYVHTDNSLRITVSAVERMRILSTGNVGIGTASPTHRLVVDHPSDNYQLAVGSSPGFRYEQGRNTTDGLYYFYGQQTGFTGYVFSGVDGERMRITPGGSVGIGVSTPNVSLDVLCDAASAIGHRLRGRAADNLSFIQFTDNISSVGYATINGQPGGLTLTAGGSRFINFVTNSSEHMRIDATGNILVNTSAIPSSGIPGVLLANPERTACRSAVGSVLTRNHWTFYNPAGLVGSISTNSTATSYNTSSDVRLKENIIDAPSAESDIAAIRIRSFDWKADGSHQKYGVIAQELIEVAPEAVNQGGTWGVDYSKLVPMMIKEIQSLRGRVIQLEAV